jgi:hypothetical protein
LRERREAAIGFPANLNVAVALSLAGIGADRMTLEIWADPSLARLAEGHCIGTLNPLDHYRVHTRCDLVAHVVSLVLCLGKANGRTRASTMTRCSSMPSTFSR